MLIVATLAIPFAVGLLVKGTLTGALLTLVWGGLARIFLPFATGDRSTNVAWLSLATLGESWHNNHHALPTSVHPLSLLPLAGSETSNVAPVAG